MNLKEEMLYQVGVDSHKNIVSDLIVGGLFFNENLNRDLTRAVRGGAITLSESNKIKRMSNADNEFDYFFENLLPKVKKELEKTITIVEGQIENASTIEENELLVEKLEDLREKYNKVRDI